MALTEVSNTINNKLNKAGKLVESDVLCLSKKEDKENLKRNMRDTVPIMENKDLDEKHFAVIKSSDGGEIDDCNANDATTTAVQMGNERIGDSDTLIVQSDDLDQNELDVRAENEQGGSDTVAVQYDNLGQNVVGAKVKNEQVESDTVVVQPDDLGLNIVGASVKNEQGDSDTLSVQPDNLGQNAVGAKGKNEQVESDTVVVRPDDLGLNVVGMNVKNEQADELCDSSGTENIPDIYDKKVNGIKCDTQMATPIAVRKIIASTSVKDSPSTPGHITDEMIKEEQLYKKEDEKQLEEVRAQALDELSRTGKQERFDRLQSLLNRSEAYSTYLLGRVNARREKEEMRASKEEKKKLNEAERKKEKNEKQKVLEIQNDRVVREKDASITIDASSDGKGKNMKKRKRKSTDIETDGLRSAEKKKQKGGIKSSSQFVTDADKKSSELVSSPANKMVVDKEKIPEQQPKLLTGGALRKYQIEGMEWLIGLYENGINGILADEMGLGKTLQSIALICNLIEQKVIGPYLIAAPLSTLPNWIAEFKKFAPEVYTILYHGSKDERFEKRQKLMRIKRYSHGLCSLPVVISSYEILMRDRVPLSGFGVEWKYLIVDEGHRIKNLNCKLIKELKLYNTGNRLLLTGTPLQNNLAELWSLLNFLLPDIFDDLSSFQQWFDFSAISSSDFIADEQEAAVLQTLHSILNPFLLRRLKTEVDLSIPPKREVLVYCPMTAEQQNYYKTTLDKTVLNMIAEKNSCEKVQELTPTGRPMRKSAKNIKYIEYDEEMMIKDDQTYDFDLLIKQVEDDENRRMENEIERRKKEDKKAILNIRLVNTMMMLRKCCNHPYLLEYPYDAKTNQLIIDDRLLKCSGKLLMLDKMLVALVERGHKVLVFSQMCLMLDIIVDFLNLKKMKYSRLDGTMKVQDRHTNIEKFNNDPDTCIFLLSTRAGGLGLNLMMADTCIIYDSDWNPQVDLQAQDRCHRIGQKKPVVIYRLVTANTIDQRILERASLKRKLEKMVIHEKRFKGKALTKALTPTELIKLLESSDVSATLDTQNVITDEQLELLLDRSDLYKMMKKSSNDEHDKNKEEEEKDIEVVPSSNKLFTVVETCISDKVIF